MLKSSWCWQAPTFRLQRSRLTVFALTLALLAAVMHAVWNLLVKSSEDQLVAGWTVVAGAAILALPVLVLSGLPDRSVWDLILISTVVQVVYVLTLAAAYRVGDLSFVYPLARGPLRCSCRSPESPSSVTRSRPRLAWVCSP